MSARAWLLVCALALAGAGFGAVIQLGGSADWWGWHLGGLWLLAAFLGGLATRDLRRAAALGSLVLVAAVLGYYATQVLRRGGELYALQMILLWGVAAGPLGAAFGAAGGLARRRVPAGSAVLGGALGGEAALFLLTRGAAATFLAELAAGAALPIMAGRRRTLGLAVAMGALSLMGLAALRVFMHAHGWRGP